MNDFIMAVVFASTLALAWLTGAADVILPEYLQRTPSLSDVKHDIIGRIEGTTLCKYSGITCDWDVFSDKTGVVVDLTHNKLSDEEAKLLSSAVLLRVSMLAAYQLGKSKSNVGIIPSAVKTPNGFKITLTLEKAQ